jgi:hypothetical protein
MVRYKLHFSFEYSSLHYRLTEYVWRKENVGEHNFPRNIYFVLN